jgi:cellulose synthase/poly-beta-1,6-N-acetylglucosamine synthase-like glycosyltransferase
MYNEPFLQLIQTLAGVYRSYYELCNIDDSFVGRAHITIIADGYDKIDTEFLRWCEKAGIYNEFKTKRWRNVEIPPGTREPIHKIRELNFINETTMNSKKRIYGTNNIVHWFSREVSFPDFFNALSEDEASEAGINGFTFYDFLLGDYKRGKVKSRLFYHLPMPVHFCIKHRNQGKIESHKWFFKGFWEYMNPKYAQILDCGSIPLWNSISHIIMHMEDDPQVGGACGEIEWLIPEKKTHTQNVSFFENVMLKAQYVEYKLSHYLDKSTETLFGFVSVLPGAFSTFRWECINGKPLQQFLKGSNDEFGDITKIRTWASANKYLAEDRIMCLEILAKRHKDYVIHYVPGAKCLTDPPMSLTDLMKQRRRWFNGSMFASLYVLKHMWRVWGRSKWSCCRNLFLMLLYLYLIVSVLLYFIIVGIFYAVFSIFLRAVLPSDDCLSITSAANVIENVYVIFLVLTLLLSTSVEITWAENGYRIWSFFMGLFTLLMLASSVVYALDATFDSLGVVFLVAFILSYLVPLVLNCRKIRFTNFITGAIYATYLSPTYINILTIYAISNIHDVSWGSRPSEKNSLLQALEKRKGMLYKNFRSNFLILWIIINVAVGAAIITLSRNDNFDVDVIFYLGAFLLVVMLFKIFFSILSFFKSKIDQFRVYRLIKKRKSEVFSDPATIQEMNKEEVFAVYFDHDGNFKRTTTTDEFEYNKSPYKSSINSQKTFRGFNLKKLTEQHRIQQGIVNNFLGKLGTRRFYTEKDSKIAEAEIEKDDSSEKEESKDTIAV